MSSSDPMERAAQRIAIDYPVEILRPPAGKKPTAKRKTGRSNPD